MIAPLKTEFNVRIKRAKVPTEYALRRVKLRIYELHGDMRWTLWRAALTTAALDCDLKLSDCLIAAHNQRIAAEQSQASPRGVMFP